MLQILQNFGEILGFLQKLPEFSIFLNFSCKILKIQLAHFVDLEKRCNMCIWLQKSALLQPRTSPRKFGRSTRRRRLNPGGEHPGPARRRPRELRDRVHERRHRPAGAHHAGGPGSPSSHLKRPLQEVLKSLEQNSLGMLKLSCIQSNEISLVRDED